MASMKRLTPSQHEEKRIAVADEQKLFAEQKHQEFLALRRAVDRILDSDDGRVLWRWIFNRLGWVKPSLAYFAAGDVAPMKTECLAALRDAYADLRAIASPDLRMKAEDFAENNIKGGK